jgi:uncharacterized protein YraI
MAVEFRWLPQMPVTECSTATTGETTVVPACTSQTNGLRISVLGVSWSKLE